MASSILIPSTVAEKTSKRLGKLANTAGVEFAKVPGETTIFRRAYETFYKRDHYTGKLEPYKRLAVDTNQALVCERFTIGELPRFNGHTFIGKVTHTKEGNMLALARQFTDREVPFDWRAAKATCDHCCTARSRKETFLLQATDGSIVRVGRNCLADFLMASPEQLIALSVFQDVLRECSGESDEDGEGCGGWGGWRYSPLHFLACAVSVTERVGFISREQADIRMMQSTRNTTEWLADSGNKDHGREDMRQAWRDGQPTVEHWARAVECLLWLEAQDSSASQYMHNLKVAILQPVCDNKNAGIIASLPNAYARAMGEASKRAAVSKLSALASKNEHYGTVGERNDFHVTVTGAHGYVGSFGPGTVVTMLTDDGLTFVSFATGNAPSEQDVGKRMAFRGTIKAHTERKGVKQTIFNRCIWSENE